MVTIGQQIAGRRKELKLSQNALALRGGVSRATLDALENGRAGEIGFSKLDRLLTALGLEIKIQTARAARPTLEDLLEDDLMEGEQIEKRRDD